MHGQSPAGLSAREDVIGALRRRFSMSSDLVDGALAASPELLAELDEPAQSTGVISPWHVEGSSATPVEAVAFHALSPLGDTAFLLASLGQARRLACVLGTPLAIVLCDVDIAKHNRVVAELGEEYLANNRAFREQLYAAIGAQTRPASLSNMPDVDASNLWERAHWVHARGGGDGGCPTRSGECSAEVRVRGELHGCLRTYFNATDRRTAFYFLVQRHHQHRYAHHLKLGNPRERRFDEAAHRLDRLEYGSARGVRSALYVSDYVIGRSCRTAMTMHAYCFPSGTAFDRSRSVAFCRSISLHLADLGDVQRAETAFLALRPPHDTRFLADLLSFIHFYVAERRRSAPLEVSEALHRVAPEWAESWNQYCVDADSFARQTRRWFQAYRVGACGGPPPYHVYPWLLPKRQRRERLVRAAIAVTHWLASELVALREFSGGRCPAGLAQT